jgi:hypothetical protein
LVFCCDPEDPDICDLNMTFGFAEDLRLWFVFGLGATFCLEDEAPHVLAFSCPVGLPCPESRRSVNARSIVNGSGCSGATPKSGMPQQIYQNQGDPLWAIIRG